jgi:hypothetical protein
MYADNPKMKKPENENAKIWRYMDLPKFVSLLDTKSLFFRRLDRLQSMDKFEGSLTEATLESMNKESFRKFISSVQTDEQRNRGIKNDKKFRQLYRKMFVVNCWHMNDVESDAMWGLYAPREAGIAVRSTFKRLKDSLSDDNQHQESIGIIKYINYEKEVIEGINRFYPLMYKRLSFEHEKELRAWVVDKDRYFTNTDGETKLDAEPFEKDLYVPVDLNVLIERIFVSPTSQNYFLESVKSVANKFGIDSDIVKRSSLACEPPC